MEDIASSNSFSIPPFRSVPVVTTYAELNLPRLDEKVILSPVLGSVGMPKVKNELVNLKQKPLSKLYELRGENGESLLSTEAFKRALGFFWKVHSYDKDLRVSELSDDAVAFTWGHRKRMLVVKVHGTDPESTVHFDWASCGVSSNLNGEGNNIDEAVDAVRSFHLQA